MRSREAFVAELGAVFRQYCQGTADARETRRLIRLAGSIVEAALAGRLLAAARAQDTSPEQMAMSIVGGLFVASDSEAPIVTALRDEIESNDLSLFLRFKSIVVGFARQELFHRWDEHDALSARLWRTVRRVVRLDPRLTAFPCNHPEWVTPTGVDDLRPELPPADHGVLVRLIAARITPNYAVADLIAGVLSDLAEGDSYQRAVRIDALFAALRETCAETLAGEMPHRTPSYPPDPVLHIAIEHATTEAKKEIEKRLDRYQEKRKLTVEMAEAFRQALSDLLSDCADGGPARSYFEYVNIHLPDLSLSAYRRQYRTMFEYLAEKAREQFWRTIRDEYVRKRIGK